MVGADTTPKGFLAPNAGERWDDPDWLRFRLLGMTNPAYFALYARRRMDLYGATERGLRAGQGQERPARPGQPERALPQGGHRRGRARLSAVVSDPLHLLDICATSDGAAAVVLTQTRLRPPSTASATRCGSGAISTVTPTFPNTVHRHAEPLDRPTPRRSPAARADLQGVDRARGVRGGRHRTRGRRPGRGLRPLDRARAGLDRGPRRSASAARPRRCCAPATPPSAAGSRSTPPAGWPASARPSRRRRWPRSAR